MQSLLNCPKCNAQFNLKSNQPQVLQCKHDLCKKCCFELFQNNQKITCPVQNCGQQTQVDPLDLEVNNNLLNSIQQKVSNNCKIHSLQIIRYCFNDQQLLCQKCIEANPHTNHMIKEIAEVQQQFNNEIPQIHSSLKESQIKIQSNLQKIQSIYQQIPVKDQEFQKFICQEAEQTIDMINDKRVQYCNEHQQLTDELLKMIDKRTQNWQEIQILIREQNIQHPTNFIDLIELMQKVQDVEK